MDKTCQGSKKKIARESTAARVKPEMKQADKCRTAATHKVAVLLIFVILGFFIYSNTLKSPFFFDDRAHIQENRHIRLTKLDFKDIIAAGFESPSPTRPIANISFGLNYYFHRYNVIGYHCTNICIHILTGILLYFFVKSTLSISFLHGRYRSCRQIAFFSALLWLVHPLQTQSVTYIVQRMNSMAAMFYILSLLLYVKGRLAVQEQKRSWVWFIACSLAGVLSFGCKEMAATLPVFILVYEWYFFQDLRTAWLKRYLPYVIGVFIAFCLLGLWYLGSRPLEHILSGYDRRDFTLTERLLTQSRVVIYYISLLGFPNPGRLNLDHDFALSHSLVAPAMTLVCIATIMGLIGLAIYVAKRERLLSFCILWFFGNLVIESSVIGLEMVHEHRLYLPSMLVITAVIAVAWGSIKQNWIRIPIFCILILLCSIWTYERNSVWADPVTLWKDCADKSPGKPRPNYNLASSLLQEDRNDEAIEYFTKTLLLDPNRSDAHLGFGVALVNKGRADQAIGHYTEALRLKPDYVDALINLGLALAEQDKPDQAIHHYRKALALNPNSDSALSRLGAALAAQGHTDQAIGHYRHALSINPDSDFAHLNLALALAGQNKFDQAIGHYRQALKINPNSAEAHNFLGVALKSQGQLDEAILLYRQSLKIKPDYAAAYSNLGNALQALGRFGESISNYRKALKIAPDSVETSNNLAWLLATCPRPEARQPQEAVRLAKRSAEMTKYENPAILDTLAAAYASAGLFEQAITTAEKGLSLASAARAAGLADQIRSRLELYKHAKPYYEPELTKGPGQR